MKLSIKTSQGGGMFGGGPSSEVTIEGQDYEAAPAIVAALNVLAQNGIGEFPTGDDETVGTTSEDTGDDVPAAGWKDDNGMADWQAGDQSPSPVQRVSDPGDAVRITWHGDDSSRLFIDSGTMWVSPAIAGLITEPMSVEYNTTDITVEVVAPFESNRNRGA